MNTNTDLAIEAVALTKAFGQVKAVDGVDLHVGTGAVYGFLGPNGAGKTTTIRMLATLLRPDSGNARVLGHDVVREADAVRRRVSLTGQFASLDGDLTARENLLLLARLLGHSRTGARARAADLLDAFDLPDAADRQVKALSGGMRRRLDIAASLIIRPDLLFLDEPTTGLDPRSRSQVWDTVRALAADGTTVLLTTQYLDEADQLAERIAVIDQGRVIAEGTTNELKASVGAGAVRVRLGDHHQRSVAAEVLARTVDTPVRLEPDPASISLQVADPELAARALAALFREGVAVADFALSQPTLDEVFLVLTGRSTAEELTTDEEAA